MDEWEGELGVIGLSYFFEYLMFKGMKKYFDYFKVVSVCGGKFNVFIWLDVMVYWEKLVVFDFEFVLDLELDWLKYMWVDFFSFELECEVVKSECLMCMENSFLGLLYEVVGVMFFNMYSYYWFIVGWM